MGRVQGNLLGAEVEGTARRGVRAKDPGHAHVHPSGRRGTHEKASKLADREVPVILPGKGEDAPDPGLGKVVRGLLPAQGDAVPHSPKEVADRVQPLRVLEKGPDTLQDHETWAEDPAQLDEVEDNLPPRVAKPLPVPNPAEGLAGETGGDDLHASVGRPEGSPLDGVACGPGSLVPGVGSVVCLHCRPSTSQAQTVRAPRARAATENPPMSQARSA